jgi:hypothetical protein
LLTSCGLRRCQEACIYKYYVADGWILIASEVDDLSVNGTNDKKTVELQKVFEDKWGVKQWGDIHTFLGLRVEPNIKEMLKRFPELGKLPYKTVPLQLSQANKELKVGEIKPLNAIDDYLIKVYPRSVGTMIYTMVSQSLLVRMLLALLKKYPVECINPTGSVATCSRTSLAICEA